ncbi:MAG TPA: hypothetical protein PLR88_10445 [Bacteroidales bacterium]|nr:hypothetical protein [Bacteroidales bacterium]
MEPAVMDWAPYKKNDQIAFSSKLGITTFNVLSYTIYHTEKVGYRTECSCGDYLNIILNSEKLFIKIEFYDSNSPAKSYIIVSGETLSFSKQMDRLDIGGRTYYDLLVYEDSGINKNKNYTSAILSKNMGIIEIKGINDEWFLSDPATREIKLSDVNYVSSDCS